MSHVVLARKYRPRVFKDVIYQEPITTTLQNAIRAGRIAHAYLFSGPRGVGKTSLARILAGALNCLTGPAIEPCGKCDVCMEISNGTSMDIIEIDGASNNSVDNIRELRESVKFAPVRGRYKVYIIDEVHMLTQSAFNALLKTLEEPPAHIIFILATTEIHKIPATILSRCQRFQFRKIPLNHIVATLTQIVKKEGFAAERESLFWIARQSEGSLRDAQSILEQLFSFSGQKKGETGVLQNPEIVISIEDVKNLLGIPDFDLYIQILLALKKQEPRKLINVLEEGFASGLDVSRFVQGILDFIRVLLLVSQGINEESVLQFPSEEIEALAPLLEIFTGEDLHFLFDLFRTIPADFRYVADDRLLVEMAFLKAMDQLDKPTVAKILDQIADVLDSSGDNKQTSKIDVSAVDVPPVVVAPPAVDVPPVVDGPLENKIKLQNQNEQNIRLNSEILENNPASGAQNNKSHSPQKENLPDEVKNSAMEDYPGKQPKDAAKVNRDSDIFKKALKIFDGTEITRADRERYQNFWKLSNSE